jgi:cytosine deaminase
VRDRFLGGGVVSARSGANGGSRALVLRDVRLPSGCAADLRITGETIAQIGTGLAEGHAPGEILDGRGHLVLPGLVDGHIHLDKTLTGLPWMAHPAGPTRQSRIETERRMRASLPPVAGRASSLVRQCIAHGTAAIRTHVDIVPEIGLAHLHALLEVRDRFAEHVLIQIVAFPQVGVVSCPGQAALLDAALAEGADLVGGIDPMTFDGDAEGQLDVLFEIAVRHGAGIDVHLHDAGAAGLAEITALAERTRVHGLAGRVTASHGFCLGAASEPDFDRVAGLMADAGVSLATHGGGASPLPPVKRLRERGVEVFAGNDDVRDPWSPYGDGDMLERAMLLAWRSGFRTDADLGVALECASAAGARALGLQGYGLAPGCRADLYTLDAQTPAEAVVSRPRRSLVLKGGRVVARDGDCLELPSSGAQ